MGGRWDGKEEKLEEKKKKEKLEAKRKKEKIKLG